MSKSKKPIMITHKGKTQNLSEWCRELGLDYSTCRKRYRRGMSIDMVLDSETCKILVYKNNKYTVQQLCQKYNLNKKTVYYRLSAGWSVEDVVETPPDEIPVSERTEENMKYGRYSYFLQPYFNKNTKK